MIHLSKTASSFLEGKMKNRKPLTKVIDPQSRLLVTLFTYKLVGGDMAWEYVQSFTPFKVGLKTSTGKDFRHE